MFLSLHIYILYSAPSPLRKLAYLTFVRPHLEYASPIWSPHQKYLIDALEIIQNRASRFIAHNYSNLSSNTQIKSTLSLPSLSTRRNILLLSLFHKVIHSDNLSLPCLNNQVYTSQRLHNTLSYARLYGATQSFNFFPLPRAVHLWNSLPDNIASLGDHDAFCLQLNKLFPHTWLSILDFY